MRLIAVIGASPGIGKSTLCEALVDHLRGKGLMVDHFEEADVLSRPEFASVAAEFSATGVVGPRTLVDATVAYLNGAVDVGVDVVVADALMPYVPTLLAGGLTEPDITRALGDLVRRTPDVETLAVFLDGDAATALRRAAAREKSGWLDWYGEKLAGFALVPVPPQFSDLCAYLADERDLTLRVLESLPWHTLVIADAIDQPTDAVVHAIGRARAEPIA